MNLHSEFEDYLMHEWQRVIGQKITSEENAMILEVLKHKANISFTKLDQSSSFEKAIFSGLLKGESDEAVLDACIQFKRLDMICKLLNPSNHSIGLGESLHSLKNFCILQGEGNK